jgi:hypothetical protein
MKAFQKLALVSAIAAAPFAQAELVSIDDALMGEMTGQAGISIELSAKVDIGSVVYTDTDGLANGAGTLSLANITLGGSNGTGAIVGALDEIKIDIDVDANDGLVIHLGGTNLEGVLDGSDKVDFGLSVGSVGVNNQATLASNIFIGGNLGPIDVTIANDSSIAVTAFFEVTEGSMTVDVLGMGISNLKIGQDSSPFLLNALSPYQQAAALTAGVEAADFGAASNGALVTPATAAVDIDGSGTIETSEWLLTGADLDGDGTITFAEADTALAGGTGAITGAAVNATAKANAPGVGDMAFVAMDIVTTDTLFIDKAGVTTNITSALDIQIAAMSMDIGMDVSLGGVGIGRVAINDLDLSGTSLKIYGH